MCTDYRKYDHVDFNLRIVCSDKVILGYERRMFARGSPVCHAMINNNMIEMRNNTVVLEYHSDAVIQVLSYMDKLVASAFDSKIKPDILINVFSTAHMWMLESLKKICIEITINYPDEVYLNLYDLYKLPKKMEFIRSLVQSGKTNNLTLLESWYIFTGYTGNTELVVKMVQLYRKEGVKVPEIVKLRSCDDDEALLWT